MQGSAGVQLLLGYWSFLPSRGHSLLAVAEGSDPVPYCKKSPVGISPSRSLTLVLTELELLAGGLAVVALSQH